MTATFHVGDAIEVMGKLPEKSVDLILTSPPFLALRSYLPADHPDKDLEGGSQPTPGAFIDWLIDVVEACDRVLAPHGSLCIELGDTYAGSGGAGGDYNPEGLREGQPKFRQQSPNLAWRLHPDGSVKTGTEVRASEPKNQAQTVPVNGGTGWPLPKSLSLIPELFRLTLVYGTNPLTGRTTERWRLRNVVRWVRPNPPVGALGDKFRPATSELMVFCKSAKRYFDLDAVREPYAQSTIERGDGGSSSLKDYDFPNGDSNARRSVNLRDRKMTQSGAPPLDWWNIPPGGFSGAHYAVWPPELLIKPIKAMSPERVCRVCGEPSRRIVKTERVGFNGGQEGIKTREQHRTGGPFEGGGVVRVITGETWFDCGHDDWRPGVVLDPFVGSGTTLMVATGHGRDAIGIDLDSRNFDLALERVGPFILERAL